MDIRVDPWGHFLKGKEEKGRSTMGKKREVSQGLHLGQGTWLKGTRKGKHQFVWCIEKTRTLRVDMTPKGYT